MSKQPRGSFRHWPSRAVLGAYLKYGSLGGLWFALVYYGAEWAAQRRSHLIDFATPFDLSIPFVAPFVLAYVSMYLFFFLPPFVLRTEREIKALVAAQSIVILIAGVFFLLFPGATVYPQPKDLGGWHDLVVVAQALAMQHNYAPSLHVALSVLFALVLGRQAGPLGKALLWLWAALIVASTLLVHEHYLVDVASGFLLGLGGVYLAYDPLTRSREASTGKVRFPPVRVRQAQRVPAHAAR
jgi:membrane-associated phospholipid phosphatase